MLALMAALSLAAAPDAALLDEAREFMDGYARDLLADDRAAIVARYCDAGAWRGGTRTMKLYSPTELTRHYARGSWNAPVAFAWRDLEYETLGPDSAMVTGGFTLTPAGGKHAEVGVFSAVLLRQDRSLCIRLEHENFMPSRP